MRIAVLGVTEAWLGEKATDLRTFKQRAMLSALALHAGRPVSPDQLVDLVWGDDPPVAASATLQSYIARLRRDLDPSRPPRAPSRRLLTVPGGYLLAVDRENLDSASFEAAVVGVHAGLQLDPRPAREPAAVFDARLRAALALWRGTAFADLGDAIDVVAERSRLDELRVVALEDLAALGLAQGLHATTAGDLEALTEAYPLRERLWGLRATALVRSGRQAEALSVLQDARRRLDDELGLEPGPDLQALQTAILRQDPRVFDSEGSGEPSAVVLASRPSLVVSQELGPRHQQAPGWSFVGRRRELSALSDLVQAARRGSSAAAVLTGERGAGASRLCAELVLAAEAAGVRVVAATCAAVEGAPPLWAWGQVMGQLGLDLPTASEGVADQFQAWDAIVDAVLAAAAERPLLLVMEDLHEADVSSLRVLQLLAEARQGTGLLLVVTWHSRPILGGPLGETAAAFARRHAPRVELAGLSLPDASDLATSIVGRQLTAAQAAALHERTEGNPYFVVEFCRLAGTRGSLEALLDDAEPPRSVTDVVEQQLATLSSATRRTLQSGATAGRAFDLTSLAIATDRDEDELLDDLDEALAAGVLVEEGVDRYRFAHSLTSEVLYAGLSRSRRARLHARLAQALEHRPGRESEVARHWLAAGERHARSAWSSALLAADWAARLYAYDEALGLVRSAASSVALDLTATPAERGDVELAFARALQRAGVWSEVRPVIHRALGFAMDTGDLTRLVEVVTLPLTGALWQAAGHGFVDDVVVGALRVALARLPDGDSAARCRVLLALAGELYYARDPGPAEREALVENAVSVARRLGDQDLLVWALLTGSTATWRAATAGARLAKLDEAVTLTRQLALDLPGGESSQTLSSALALRAMALMELGRVAEMEVALVEARTEAERQHHLFALLVVDSVRLPWAAMRGEDEESERIAGEVVALSGRIGVFGDAAAAATTVRAVWEGDAELMLRMADAIEATSPLPTWHFCAVLRLRAGRRDLARAGLIQAAPGASDLERAGDAWYSPLAWAMAAEVALAFDDVDLATQGAARMRPYRGTLAHTGSVALGPLDAFAAMAAAATGSQEEASSLAEQALQQCEDWRIPLVRDWFLGARAAYGF